MSKRTIIAGSTLCGVGIAAAAVIAIGAFQSSGPSAGTTTNATGHYTFTNLPAVMGDEQFYILWRNQERDSQRLFNWSCGIITVSTTIDTYSCSFDVMIIHQRHFSKEYIILLCTCVMCVTVVTPLVCSIV